jgi:DnaJ-class molecular chaperone
VARADSEARETCPGCGGRGIVVSLNTVMACGRCHGSGTIDPVREQAEKDRQDAEALTRVQADIQQYVDFLRRGSGRADG